MMENELKRLSGIFTETNWQEIALSTALLGVAILIGLILYLIAFRIFKHVTKRTENPFDNSLYLRVKAPARPVCILFTTILFLPMIHYSLSFTLFLKQIISIALISSIAWLIISLFYFMEDVLLTKFDIHQKDNLQARKIHTQMKVLNRIIVFPRHTHRWSIDFNDL